MTSSVKDQRPVKQEVTLRGYISRINWHAVLALIGGLLLIGAATPGRIALAGYCPPIQGSSLRTIVYGGLTVNGGPGPVGSVVEAHSPRGDLVGCFVVENAGDYGAMYVYGEDTSVSPTIPGMRSSETIAFSVDGVPATSTPNQTWANDWKTVSHQVALAAILTSPPPPASSVQATVSENDLTLTWSPGNAYANHYEVWRGTTPYFDPSAPGCNSIVPVYFLYTISIAPLSFPPWKARTISAFTGRPTTRSSRRRSWSCCQTGSGSEPGG